MTSSWHPVNVEILKTRHFRIYLDVEKVDRWIFLHTLGRGSQINTLQHCQLGALPCTSRSGDSKRDPSYLLLNDVRMKIYFLFGRFLESKMSKIYNYTQQLSRVTLSVEVTWPWAWPLVSLVLITRERWSFSCFAGFQGQGFQKYIIPHRNYHEWPCASRSRDHERDLLYLFLQWS